MVPLRLAMGFFVGVALYQGVVVFLGGIFAAIAVPRYFFNWFGSENLELALAVAQLLTFTIPVVVLVATGTLVAHFVLGLKAKLAMRSILAGLLACFVFWVAIGAFALPLLHPGLTYPTSELLRQALLPPWWAATGFWAPWVGFALAAWLLRRSGSA